jgi:TP901 family phage tail tape measure protein
MRKFIIPSVFTAVDKVSSVTKGMGKSVSNYASTADDAIARTNRRYRKLGDTAFDVAGKSALVGTALVAPMALAVKSTADFEAQMSNVGTLIDTNVESLDKMGQQILNIAKRIPVPVEELTTSLYDIRSAGIPAERAMSTLEDSAKLARAGLGTTSEATNIMTSALNAFASEGLTSGQTADILFKTVKAGKTTISALAQAFGATAPVIQSAGVGLADFQAATAALTTVGTPAAQAQTQLRASIVALQKPTKEMESIFQRLGVSSEKDLIKKFGGLGGAFKAVNDAGTEMGLNLSKAWSSVEAASAVTSITGATNEAYVNTLNEMTKGANAVETAFDKQSKTMASQAQLAKNNMQALSITVGTSLIPIVNGLLETVTPIINRFSNWARENRPLLDIIVKVAAGLAALAFVISAVAFVIGVYSKAQLILNMVMTANPIGIVVVAIGLLIAAIAYVASATTGWSETWDSALSFMSAILDLWVSSVKIYFLSIEHSFLTVVDSMVMAWKWGQNKIGLLSDEEYAKDISNIESQSKAREAAIKNSVLAASDAASRIAQGIDFQVRMNDTESPALNEKQSAMDSQTEKLIKAQMNSTLDVNLAPGLNANSMSPNVNINTSSTK